MKVEGNQNFSPLRVGLDTTPLLSGVRAGVPYYTESLIRALLESEGESGETFFLSAAGTTEQLEKALVERGFQVPLAQRWPYQSFYQVPPAEAGEGNFAYLARTGPMRLDMKWRKITGFPPRREPLDVFHHTDYLSHDWAGAKCRHVATIHDLIPLHFPDVCRPDWIWFAERAYAFAQDHVEHIITPSEATKRDIVERLGIAEERITAIPLAVRPSLLAPSHSVPSLSVPGDSLSAEAILHRFGLERDGFILSVSRLDPLKNLPRLVEAFAQCHDQLGGAKLVLTGPRSVSSREDGMQRIEETLQRHGLEKYCIFPGFVSDEELRALMGGCLAFAFPSLFEGFGLPVLEAMAQGAAVITSDVSSLPEVAGDAALLVDPYSTEAIADALARLAGDAALRAKLRAAGLARAKQFSWEATARAHEQVYRGEKT